MSAIRLLAVLSASCVLFPTHPEVNALMLSKKARFGVVAKNVARGFLACNLGNEAVYGNNTYAHPEEAASTTNNLSGLAHDEHSSCFSTPPKLERTYTIYRTKHGIVGGRPIGEDGLPHFEPFAVKNILPQEDADKYLHGGSVSLANTVSTAEKASTALLRTDIPESLEEKIQEYAENEQQIAALSADIDRLNSEISTHENSTKDDLKEELESKKESLNFWRRQQEVMLRSSLAIRTNF